MNLSLKQLTSNSTVAPNLVFVHGLGSAATAWKPLEPLLIDCFNLITVDLPGHGYSPYSDGDEMDPLSLAMAITRELSEQLGIEEFHLVGNSLGGWIALEIAAAYPERVKSVTALAPAGLWLATFVQRLSGTAMLRAFTKNFAALAPLMLKSEWARKIGFSDVSPLWRNFSYELCLDATNAMIHSPGYFPAWDGMLKKRFAAKISAEIPVKIIFGDSDNTLPARNCQERAMVPAHAQWITIAQSGHAPMWDHPSEVASYILQSAGILN
jgi:pimeloyl-ACP methyl ester carboxylesterase